MTSSRLLVTQMAAKHFDRIALLLGQLDLRAIERVFVRLGKARDSGATIYLAGNGGSSATASHFTNDLAKAAKRSDRLPIKAICLSDNTPWLTALANDEGYERVFAGQLENFARTGDVLVVISASGNSPNLVRAVELARSRGVITVGFLGFDGGVLKGLVDECVWIETEQGAYEIVEDSHSALCHMLVRCLTEDRPGRKILTGDNP